LPGEVTTTSTREQPRRRAVAACFRTTRAADASTRRGIAHSCSTYSPSPSLTRSRCTVASPVASGAATRSRSVFAPTSMTPTRLGVIVAWPPVGEPWSGRRARKASAGAGEGVAHEHRLRRAASLALRGLGAMPVPVEVELPRLGVVGEQRLEVALDLLL